MTTSGPPEHVDPGAEKLYEHSRRQQWGLAILVSEGADRRRYQFQDGDLRTFKEGFYHLMTEVNVPREEAQEIVKSLLRDLGSSLARRRRGPSRASRKPGDGFGLKDQVSILRAKFPGGFYDPEWETKVRGLDVARRAKGHRQAAIEQAQEALSQATLDRLIAAGDCPAVHSAAVSVLRATNLVSRQHVEPIAALRGPHQETFALALRDVLYGAQPREARTVGWFQLLDRACHKPVSWQAATTLQALVQPDEHVCVRPAAFRKQASVLSGAGARSLDVTARQYDRYRTLARTVRDKLTEMGEDLKARDLVDIHDFVRVTLSPKAVREFKAAKEKKKEE